MNDPNTPWPIADFMTFSSRLPLASLIELCRTLRHYLGSGLTLRDAFGLLSRKGSPALRPVATRMRRGLDRGDALEDVVHRERAILPPLFVAIVGVGERSGNLPETCGELEDYFRLQQKLRRRFWSQSTWPLLQLFAAILVVAVLIAVLGILAPTAGPNGQVPEPVGFGLSGLGGAVVFVAVAFGTLAGIVASYLIATRMLGHQAFVHELLLRIPAVGPCLQALALARLCLALRLTLETSISTAEALGLSLRATGNAAFVAREGRVINVVEAGGELAKALESSGLLPAEFGQVLVVGEESGQLPEVLGRQAKYYQEEAGRRLTFLTRAAAWGLSSAVAGLVIFLIFRIAGWIGEVQRGAGL